MDRKLNSWMFKSLNLKFATQCCEWGTNKSTQHICPNVPWCHKWSLWNFQKKQNKTSSNLFPDTEISKPWIWLQKNPVICGEWPGISSDDLKHRKPQQIGYLTLPPRNDGKHGLTECVCVCVGAFMEHHLNTYCRLYIKHIYLKGEHMLQNAWYTLVAAPFFWATNWTLKGCWICWSTLPKEG